MPLCKKLLEVRLDPGAQRLAICPAEQLADRRAAKRRGKIDGRSLQAVKVERN